DQDVKMFFAMHNASFDAGIVAWHVKRKYNGVRPITAIRFTKKGQIIRAWGGPGQPTKNIPGEKWSPYNPGTNLTPPFPGYFSGHSVFSRSSATVLSLFTDSDDFGFSTVLPTGFGRVEPNIPRVPTTFFYATFSGAAEEAGLSRLYGGIHFEDDNTAGQHVGYLIGVQAWAKALTYFNGTARGFDGPTRSQPEGAGQDQREPGEEDHQQESQGQEDDVGQHRPNRAVHTDAGDPQEMERFHPIDPLAVSSTHSR